LLLFSNSGAYAAQTTCKARGQLPAAHLVSGGGCAEGFAVVLQEIHFDKVEISIFSEILPTLDILIETRRLFSIARTVMSNHSIRDDVTGAFFSFQMI